MWRARDGVSCFPPAGSGRAAIIVNYGTMATGGYNRGTVELHATRGGIESWTIGGQQLFLDEIGMTRE